MQQKWPKSTFPFVKSIGSHYKFRDQGRGRGGVPSPPPSPMLVSRSNTSVPSYTRDIPHNPCPPHPPRAPYQSCTGQPPCTQHHTRAPHHTTPHHATPHHATPRHAHQTAHAAHTRAVLKGGGGGGAFVTDFVTNAHRDALCFMVMGPFPLQRLAVGGRRLVAVGGWWFTAVASGWRLVAVGGWWFTAVASGWRLVAVGGW